MIPAGLIGKIVDLILGPVAEKYLKGSENRKAKFAEYMADYYTSLRDYHTLLDKLWLQLKELRKATSTGELSSAQAETLSNLSTELAQNAAHLVKAFEFEWQPAYDRWHRRKKAERAALAIDIFDQQLGNLVYCAHLMDYEFCSFLVEGFGSWEVEEKNQVVKLLNPTSKRLARAVLVRPALGVDYKSVRLDKSKAPFKKIRLDRPGSYDQLIKLAAVNKSVVSKLLRRVRKFMREHFGTEDFWR